MTKAEELMAIRVLATIPELPATVEPAAATEAVASLARPAAPLAPRRVRARASFPGVSVAALALVAAAIWSLVALREALQPGAETETIRIAAEPIDAGASETTLR